MENGVSGKARNSLTGASSGISKISTAFVLPIALLASRLDNQAVCFDFFDRAVGGLSAHIESLVRYDAKRLGLKQPVKYELGIIVPTAGFVVLLYDLANHRDLPKAEDE